MAAFNDLARFEAFSCFPGVQLLATEAAASRPEHGRFIERSLSGHSEEEMPLIEQLAANILQLAGPRLSSMIDSYHWLCDTIYDEQLHFYRTGRYRLSSFAEAERLIYSDAAYMSRYLEGILLSQLFWQNHAKAYLLHTRFLEDQAPGARYLEIGPGHGLFLARAAARPEFAVVEAWDVSDESLAQTRRSLACMGITRPIAFARRDIQVPVPDDQSQTFDAIVISEVLEHLDHPDRALATLRSMLSPRGRIFINFPLNSPAPDHVFLIESIERLRAFVGEAGLSIVELTALPVTGYTLKRAIAARATVSCVISAQRAAG